MRFPCLKIAQKNSNAYPEHFAKSYLLVWCYFPLAIANKVNLLRNINQ
ncbi:hypothetical protein VAEU17_4400235 [Vibrio aestuarianus]|nr:hypothetical protein VAEU17_4400235 [Vibrio aestuarianus]